jgi:hypothetical protein
MKRMRLITQLLQTLLRPTTLDAVLPRFDADVDAVQQQHGTAEERLAYSELAVAA